MERISNTRLSNVAVVVVDEPKSLDQIDHTNFLRWISCRKILNNLIWFAHFSRFFLVHTQLVATFHAISKYFISVIIGWCVRDFSFLIWLFTWQSSKFHWQRCCALNYNIVGGYCNTFFGYDDRRCCCVMPFPTALWIAPPRQWAPAIQKRSNSLHNLSVPQHTTIAMTPMMMMMMGRRCRKQVCRYTQSWATTEWMARIGPSVERPVWMRVRVRVYWTGYLVRLGVCWWKSGDSYIKFHRNNFCSNSSRSVAVAMVIAMIIRMALLFWIKLVERWMLRQLEVQISFFDRKEQRWQMAGILRLLFKYRKSENQWLGLLRATCS